MFVALGKEFDMFPPTRRIYVLVKMVITKCVTLGKADQFDSRPDLFGELPLDKNSGLDWPGVLRFSLGCPREGEIWRFEVLSQQVSVSKNLF